MSTFTLTLCDATHSEQFTDVLSFIGEDASGRFGIQAQHARFMTALVFGLARFQSTQGWQYLALPGGILYFKQNALTLSTRHYLLDDNLERITELLQQQLVEEEQELQATRDSLHKLEQAMLQRLWQMQRKSNWQ